MVKVEIKAGLATFLTMSYILFVQPSVLSGKFFSAPTGMDFAALTTATCLICAVSSLLMGLIARLPIALGPGMGENFFFVTSLIPAATALAIGTSWQIALGVVFIAGFLFFLLSIVGFTKRIIAAFSPTLRVALVVGIGLFIALIGLENATVITRTESTGTQLNPHLLSFETFIFFFGLLLGASLHYFKIQSYILWSIIACFLLSLFKTALPEAIFSLPPSIAPLFMKLDIANALSWKLLPLILFLLFFNIFDATGTLIAVTKHAGLQKKEEPLNAKRATIASSISTMLGATIGMSTVTPFIESIAGVEQGGRTGLTSITVGILFLLMLFLTPLIGVIANTPVITSAALVLIGVAMIRWVAYIEWSDFTEVLPAFLIILGIPLTFSIANGIGIGLVFYPFIKLVTGRFKDLNVLNVALGILFLFYFLMI